MPDTDVTQVTLGPTSLRRLLKLQARTEGANLTAQAALTSAQQQHQAFQELLTEECSEAGMTIPPGGQGQVDIDWKTGVCKLRTSPLYEAPTPPQGAPMPMGNGVIPEAQPVES